MQISLFTLADSAASYGRSQRSSTDILKGLPELAVAAEASGFHGIWLPEHHGTSFCMLPTPGTLLGYMAAKTSTIRLGAACVVMPLNQPLRVAGEYAVLDQLSGGRVSMSIGRGYDQVEYECLGVSFDKSRDLLREGTMLMIEAWKGKPFTFAGPNYPVPHEFELNQLPVQNPHPELFFAMWSKGTLEMAAELGLGAMFTPFAASMSFGGLAAAVDTFKALCSANGHSTPRKTSCSYYCALSETQGEADKHKARLLRLLKALLPALPSKDAKLPPHFEYLKDVTRRLDELTLEGITDTSIAAGAPEHVIAVLERARAAGIDEVLLNLDFGGLSLEETKEQIELVSKYVIPHFSR